ncbi:hypothetical protein QTP86_023003, partial [Hemibagrus guttatus]
MPSSRQHGHHRRLLEFGFVRDFHSVPLIRSVTGATYPISGVIGHQGKIHPGQSANPSQDAHTLMQSHTTGNLETPISLEACLWTVGGNRRKPTKHGENMQTPHT